LEWKTGAPPDRLQLTDQGHMRFFNLRSILGRTVKDGIVLCRVRGGLNDMLCQIEKCWSYAEKHDRLLLVDTSQSGFLDDFGKYFSPKKERQVSFEAFDEARWQGSVRPAFLAGRVNDYTVSWSEDRKNFVEKVSDKHVTFDFSVSHGEQILVHDQCVGGKLSIRALQRLRLTSSVADVIATRLRSFRDYSAVHVRNTDYRTDYVPLFREVAASVPEGLIVLCTDDWHCQVFAQEMFGDRIRMSSDIPNTDGRPLHWHPGLDRFQTNLDAITDLLVLAMGKRLFFAKHAGGRSSGYSKLARRLSKRRNIVYGLLGRKI